MFKHIPLKLGIFGLVIASIGDAMNKAIEFFANGQMPVNAPNCMAEEMGMTHTCMTAATHLKFLGDYIHINLTYYSPGDMGIILGPLLAAIFLPIFVYQIVTSVQARYHL